ncbi:hypothetical protein DL546_009591 [Coniochaeta pulveracea]|uniref:Uncharacterized protein n=1 Tax=Coniochaeta pulveracea TaxID=177199 RepID=A0A420YKL7_9PEZI|nr:hypothetical protein DL546_009591 [Coniochaeta pulveracea]
MAQQDCPLDDCRPKLVRDPINGPNWYILSNRDTEAHSTQLGRVHVRLRRAGKCLAGQDGFFPRLPDQKRTHADETVEEARLTERLIHNTQKRQSGNGGVLSTPAAGLQTD